MDSDCSLVPMILGPAIGVLAAFVLNFLYSYREKYKNRIDILKDANIELSHALNDLKRMSSNGEMPFLRNIVWNSALNSGRLQLFSHGEIYVLAFIYEYMDRYNSELLDTLCERDHIYNCVDPMNLANKFYIMQINELNPDEKIDNVMLMENANDNVNLRMKTTEVIGNRLIPLLESLLSQCWINQKSHYYLGTPLFIKEDEESKLFDLINDLYAKQIFRKSETKLTETKPGENRPDNP